jgi:alpha-tubulin suppressor-like RCC1 family protein
MKILFPALLILFQFSCSLFVEVGQQPHCGNAVIDNNEECDPLNTSNTNCLTYGYYGGDLTCNNDCTLNFSKCEIYGWCGDGAIQDVYSEECDIGTVNGNTCDLFGYYGGEITCDASCQLDISQCIDAGKCGDGFINGNEECEGNTTEADSCFTLGYYGGELTCDASRCIFDQSDCKSYGWCGDGITHDGTGEFTETCDGTNLNGDTCISLGYDIGTLSCSSDCSSYNETLCFSCGNSIIEPGESCDGTSLGGESCLSLGNDNTHPLICDFNCNFSGCDSFPITVAGSSHSCAIGSDKFTYCWGRNDRAQVGVYNLSNIKSPIIVEGTPILTLLSAGDDHNCGINAIGDAYCWGYNYYGQVGDGTTLKRNEATEVTGGLSFTSISAGGSHSCGITYSGDSYCWGLNDNGQLGIDTTDYRSLVPVKVSGGHSFTSLEAGWGYTCGITTSLRMYCWGTNDRGQLGIGSNLNSLVPTVVSGNHLWIKTAPGGGKHTCGITNSDDAYCWGWNDSGQLGDETSDSTNVPVMVHGDYKFTMVSTNWRYSCGVTTDNQGYCWGTNFSGQLGDDSTSSHNIPESVSGNHTFLTIKAGGTHACALTPSGKTYCWGYNNNGQLGDGTSSRRLIPVFTSFNPN